MAHIINDDFVRKVGPKTATRNQVEAEPAMRVRWDRARGYTAVASVGALAGFAVLKLIGIPIIEVYKFEQAMKNQKSETIAGEVQASNSVASVNVTAEINRLFASNAETRPYRVPEGREGWAQNIGEASLQSVGLPVTQAHIETMTKAIKDLNPKAFANNGILQQGAVLDLPGALDTKPATPEIDLKRTPQE